MKKRTLLIGLGGVGGQALVALRRALTAAGMPPVGNETACLYLDAADDVASTPEWQQYADDIPFLNLKTEARSLNEMEQNVELKSCLSGMRWQLAEKLQVPVYEVERALSNQPGAGGMRRYGRALLLQSMAAVQRLLAPMTERVEQLEIHVFFSAAGGTGSGCAMDVLGYLEKLCLRKPGSVLLPYVFFSERRLPQELRLASELGDWLDLADEDVVPHCYVSTSVVDLPTQIRTVANALASGLQFFYIGGEYYDHLYDSVRPRGSAPGDRFATMGYATGALDETDWLLNVQSLATVAGEGKGPRYTMLVALPRIVEDAHCVECRFEDELENMPYHLNETAFCCLAPGEHAQAVLLQSGMGPARCEWLGKLLAEPPPNDYFSVRDDRA